MADTTTSTNQGSSEPAREEPGEGAAQSTMEELQNQVTKLQAELSKAVEESRKWEKRSKSNAEKARAYDELAANSSGLIRVGFSIRDHSVTTLHFRGGAR